MDDLLHEFLIETGEHVEAVGAQLVQLERDPSDTAMIAAVFRLLHTIKGTSGFFGLPRLGRLAHAAEALLARLRAGAPATPEAIGLILAAVDRIRFLLAEIEARQAEPDGDDGDLLHALAEPGDTAPPRDPPVRQFERPRHEDRRTAPPDRRSGIATVRVPVDALERIMTSVSELVIARNQLAVAARSIDTSMIASPLQRLSAAVSDLQDDVMRTRTQPLDRIFTTLPRLVRDLARELGKEISLVVSGGETELDRQLIERVRDPLTHLIRNCADHGIESSERRRSLGKSPTGTIQVSAVQAGGQVVIEVGDDGQGLDLARIGAKAVMLGLTDEAALARMGREAIAGFVFAPGFSTAREVTGISGRGVGLDVVRDNIAALGGSVSVQSTATTGTCFTIRIPLTLAIAPALIVRAGGQRFAIPQSDVAEIVTVGPDSPHRLATAAGASVLCVRDDVLAVAELAALLRLPIDGGGVSDEQVFVVLRAADRRFALAVGEVEDVQEVVVKPINAPLASLRLYGGHTVLGDGSIVLILDAVALAAAIGLHGRNAFKTATTSDRGTAATSRPLLTVRAGSNTVKAIPLSLISRILTIPSSTIEQAGGRLVAYRDGGILPLVPLVDGVTVRGVEQPVLLLRSGDQALGLLVDEVIDIVDGPLDVAVPGLKTAVGVSAIAGQVTELIDVAPWAPDAPGPRPIVLVVDDRPFVRDMLVPLLSGAGHDPAAVSSFDDAADFLDGSGELGAVVIDREHSGTGGALFARQCEQAAVPVVDLTRTPPPSGISAVGEAPAGFDRHGLLAALAHVLAPAGSGAR